MALKKVLCPAGRTVRAIQAAADAFMAGIVLFVSLMFFSWMVLALPGFDDEGTFGRGLCSGSSSCDYWWLDPAAGVGGRVFWVSLALSSLVFLASSGALGKTGRSTGMMIASTRPVGHESVGTDEVARPAGFRLLARWIIVLALFLVGTWFGGGYWGVGLVVLAWIPSLFGARRALYDVATGVAITQATWEEVEEPAERSAGS